MYVHAGVYVCVKVSGCINECVCVCVFMCVCVCVNVSESRCMYIDSAETNYKKIMTIGI